MKKIVLILLFTASLVAFEGAVLKGLSKYFSKTTVNAVAHKYGSNGVKALERLSVTHGKNALGVMEKYSAKYGTEGLKILSQYGEKALANRASFEMVKRFGDKGFYLVKQFPQSATKYYERYGDRFVQTADKIGVTRTMRYMDGASKYGAEHKVLHFLEKFGQKGSLFLDKHWGKLLTSGFVLLNDKSLIDSAQNIAKAGIDKGGEVMKESIKNVANSQLGWLMGLSLLLFVFFKYGLEKIVRLWKERKQ